MSKNVIVTDGNYKIVVPDSNSIVLDTGTAVGTVEITGNLLVKGTQTTVNSATLEIDDNIIVVNKNESANGVSETTAGLRVDRGGQTYEDVQFVYDESISWNDPQTQTTSQGPKGGGPQGPNFGGWAVTSASGDILSLKVANINNNNAIYFQPGGAGTLRIIRAGYKALISDNNDIPNKEYVDYEINQAVIGANIPKIGQQDTEVIITDTGVGKIEFKVDNTLLGLWKLGGNNTGHLEIYNGTTDIASVRIEDATISGLNSNQDLNLIAPGTGSVRINDSMIIENMVSDPPKDNTGIKLYAKTTGGGGTGLNFVNTNDSRGEVISTNRALLFGLIF